MENADYMLAVEEDHKRLLKIIKDRQRTITTMMIIQWLLVAAVISQIIL